MDGLNVIGCSLGWVMVWACRGCCTGVVGVMMDDDQVEEEDSDDDDDFLLRMADLERAR